MRRVNKAAFTLSQDDHQKDGGDLIVSYHTLTYARYIAHTCTHTQSLTQLHLLEAQNNTVDAELTKLVYDLRTSAIEDGSMGEKNEFYFPPTLYTGCRGHKRVQVPKWPSEGARDDEVLNLGML